MPDETRTHAADPSTASHADPGGSTADHGARPGPPPAPRAADRYEVGDEVARGGMGTIHRATDTAFGRVVAIKSLLGGFGPSSGAARRFDDEARITGQLQHPNIPPVHDRGTLPDGCPFLAMKFIKGETLDALLKARAGGAGDAADRGRLLSVFEKVCEAVAFAHSKGVIHRDLKPANVMVGAFGEVQVMDWGLAKILASGGCQPPGSSDDSAATTAGETGVRTPREHEFTQAGSVLGTPAYMPPEQAIGAIDQIDRRSDVFGLGGILAAILTGRPPFQGETAESTRQLAAKGRVQDCFARLDGCDADPELVALAKRCLAPEKDDRPADAGAVAAEVAALRAAVEERARRADLDRATQRLRLRLVAAVAAGLLALVAGVAVVVHQSAAAARAELKQRELKGEVDLAQTRAAAAARENDLLRESSLSNEGVAEFTMAALKFGKSRMTADALRQSEADIQKAAATLERARGEFSPNPTNSFFLGMCYLSLAERKLAKNTRADSDAALALLGRAEGEFAHVLHDTSGTGLAHMLKDDPTGSYQYAIDIARLAAFQNLGRYSEALEALDRAYPKARAATPEVPLSQDVVVPNFAVSLAKLNEINKQPGFLLSATDEEYRFYRELHIRGAEMEQSRLPWSRGKSPDHAKAMRLAAYLADTRGVGGPAVFNAACAFAVASAEAGIDAAEKDRRAAVAVGYLDRLVRGGYFRNEKNGKKYRDEIAKDTDLDPLRDRGDFKRVLADALRPVEPAPPRPK